jgi:hypothetical protein
VIQLQREADDLAKTAQSIPSDVESVRKGMLPKDVLQKLRQIEKLPKCLRSEVESVGHALTGVRGILQAPGFLLPLGGTP